MSRTRLKRTVGNYVTGDRFFGREAELEWFIQHLDEGDHLLLVAQRRMGKTSLMHEASRRIADRYICLHVDLQGSASAADAIAELSAATYKHQSLWAKTQELFANALGRVALNIESLQINELKLSLRSGMTAGDWQSKGDRLLEILAASDKPVVVFCDEVPILVSRMLKGDDYQITPERRQQTDIWMSWLRGHCIRYQGKLRFVVTGSIGLEPLLRQAGLSATINHFTPFDLQAWSGETARHCWDALANEAQLQFDPGAQERMLEAIGICIPYHVQMFFNHLYQSCRLEGRQTISVELVERVYQQKMLGVKGHADLSHLEERLKLVVGRDQHPMVLELLTEAAVVGTLTSTSARTLCKTYGDAGNDAVLREVLGILEHDGYLVRRDGAYAFESHLLRDWWKAHYGFGYVPVSEREGQ